MDNAPGTLHDSTQPRPVLPPLVVALLAADAAMALAAGAGFVFGSHGGLWDLVRLGEESNVPTWYSSSQLLLIALLLAPLAVRDVRLRAPRTWPLVLVPAFFALLSLDEAAMLHERLGDWARQEAHVGEGLRTGPWMFVYGPLIGALLLAAFHAGWPYLRGRRRALRLLGVGVVAFGVVAVGFEFAGNFVAEGSLAQKGLGFLEEIGEMAAATLLAWGALEVVRLEGVAVSLGAPGRPEQGARPRAPRGAAYSDGVAGAPAPPGAVAA
jgi:hypothetical protein